MKAPARALPKNVLDHLAHVHAQGQVTRPPGAPPSIGIAEVSSSSSQHINVAMNDELLIACVGVASCAVGFTQNTMPDAMHFPPPGKSYAPTAKETAVMRKMLGAMPLAAKREMTLREQLHAIASAARTTVELPRRAGPGTNDVCHRVNDAVHVRRRVIM